MKLIVQGKGLEVNLDKRNFLAKGGEGEIYVKGQTVYKICEPGKMIPGGKFAELAVLQDPHIIKPEDILLDTKNTQVGYTMKFVPDTFTLCQIFTKAFRNRNNITPEMSLALIRQMQSVIQYIHKNKILLVDLNELNFLLSQSFKDVWFIDVNSYQTPSYRATAIMDSIRDRHCHNNQFTEVSDWFSFAIVAFQMFIGIHPFKGKHPSYTDLHTALDERMKKNISVLNPDVSYPKGACQDLSVIPQYYLQWFEAVFEKGQRVAPPTDLVAFIHVVTQTIKTIVGSNNFDIVELHKFTGEITQYYNIANKEVAIVDKLVYIDKRPSPIPAPNIKIAFTPKMNRPIGVYFDNKKIKLYDFYSQSYLTCDLEGTNLMDYNGRIYFQNGENIMEIIFTELTNNILISSHRVVTCMEQATTFYNGAIVQSLFDSYYISVFPNSKQCYQFSLRELDDHKVVDAKYENRVLMIVGVNKQGHYDRFVYRFNDKMEIALMKVVADVSFTSINFTVLDNKICICLTEDEKIEIFKADIGSSGVKVIDDQAITGNMELTKKGGIALLMQSNTLYSFSVRKNP